MFLSACNYPTGVRKSPAGDRVTFNVSPTCIIEAAANLQGEVSKARTVIFSQPSSEPPEFCPQPPRSPGAAGSEPLRSSTGRDGDRGQGYLCGMDAPWGWAGLPASPHLERAQQACVGVESSTSQSLEGIFPGAGGGGQEL